MLHQIAPLNIHTNFIPNFEDNVQSKHAILVLEAGALSQCSLKGAATTPLYINGFISTLLVLKKSLMEVCLVAGLIRLSGWGLGSCLGSNLERQSKMLPRFGGLLQATKGLRLKRERVVWLFAEDSPIGRH